MKAAIFGKIVILFFLMALVLTGILGTLWFRAEPAATEGIRHVVLISIDTCRADHLGCYGYPRKTSVNIDAVAVEGIQFNHALTPVPITLPAHSSMLTGTTPIYHRVRDNSSYRLAPENITLAELLKKQGFSTAAGVGVFVLDSQFGLDQGFDSYDDKMGQNQQEGLFDFNERPAQQVSHWARAWLEKHYEDEHFFLFLHYFDPHVPYQMHKPFLFASRGNLAGPADRYDSEIAYTDYWIGQVIARLKELGLYESTLLIITSDHGESLGEHGESTHGFFIYYPTLRVPLIFKLPGGPKGRQIDAAVNLIDIVPTVCGLLGISVGPQMQGEDLSGYFYDTRAGGPARHLYNESLMPTKFGLGPLFGLVSDKWHYIHTARPELYDLVKDPQETDNLFDNQPQRAALMEDKLRQLVLENLSLPVADGRQRVDVDTLKRLQSLGYVTDRKVDETVEFGHSSQDPKDFIEVYKFIEDFLLLASARKFEAAKKLAYEVSEHHPEISQAHYYLGLIASYQQDPNSMKTHFSRYLELTEKQAGGGPERSKSEYEIAWSHTFLGEIFQQEGQLEQAIIHYQQAIWHNPYLTQANFKLVGLFLELDRYEPAIARLREMIKLEPDSAETLNNLAWILATYKEPKLRNPPDALKYARRACELNGYKNPNFLDTLAAAYAAAGRFDQAIKTAQKAENLLNLEQSRNAEEIRKRLELYKKNQAYFEPP